METVEKEGLFANKAVGEPNLNNEIIPFDWSRVVT